MKAFRNIFSSLLLQKTIKNICDLLGVDLALSFGTSLHRFLLFNQTNLQLLAKNCK